jgi:hypothetical protein
MLVCLPEFAQGQWLWVFEYLGRAPLLEGGGAFVMQWRLEKKADPQNAMALGRLFRRFSLGP